MISLPVWAIVVACVVGALVIAALAYFVWLAAAMAHFSAELMSGLIEGMGGPRIAPIAPRKKDRKG